MTTIEQRLDAWIEKEQQVIANNQNHITKYPSSPDCATRERLIIEANYRISILEHIKTGK